MNQGSTFRPQPKPTEVTGLVLCGGKSTRMGRDKAELELEGRRLIDYPVESLRAVAAEVLLASGESERSAELGLPCVVDPVPNGGPLAGLVAGLTAARTQWVAVLACDMPRAGRDLVGALLARAAREGLDAALFETRAGVEPLCAIYSRACLAAAREALASGERRMTAFHGGRDGLRRLCIASFSAAELGLTPAGDESAANVNTPEDYARERARGARSA